MIKLVSSDKRLMLEYLSVKEFAALLGVHYVTIRRAIKAGRINALRMGISDKSHYRIPRSEINRVAIIDLDKLIEKKVEERIKEMGKSE